MSQAGLGGVLSVYPTFCCEEGNRGGSVGQLCGRRAWLGLSPINSEVSSPGRQPATAWRAPTSRRSPCVSLPCWHCRGSLCVGWGLRQVGGGAQAGRGCFGPHREAQEVSRGWCGAPPSLRADAVRSPHPQPASRSSCPPSPTTVTSVPPQPRPWALRARAGAADPDGWRHSS